MTLVRKAWKLVPSFRCVHTRGEHKNWSWLLSIPNSMQGCAQQFAWKKSQLSSLVCTDLGLLQLLKSKTAVFSRFVLLL